MDIQIDPTYSFVYCPNMKSFIFVPMNPLQRIILEFFNEDFYDAWLNTGAFNPQIFVSFVIYQETIKVCKEMFYKANKILIEIPNELPLKVKKIFEETNDQLFEIYGKEMPFNLQENFLFYYCQASNLNQGLEGELGKAIRNIIAGPSIEEITFTIGLPSLELKTEPIYIFPNNNTTIVIVLIPNSGFSLKLFEHYQSFYFFIKTLYNHLKMIEVEK